MSANAAVEPDYSSTAALLGAVIAMSGTEIAKARWRVRPDRAGLERLERDRRDAVRALRELDAHDTAGVAKTWDDFSSVYVDLLDRQAG